MKKCIKGLLILLVALTVTTAAVSADEVNKDLCIYMQKIDGMGYLLSIDGMLYGFEEKDGITAGIGRFAEPSSETSEKMSSFVSENEKVIYFEIRAYDTETETVVDYPETVSMEAVVFMPAGTGFSAAMGKDYRVYSISDTAEGLSVTDSDLYEFSFELDTFGTYAVVYNPNAITLNFYDGENIYHTIQNLATTDGITLPENPQNKDIDGVEYEFCGWYSREEGQGLRLYDGVTPSNIGSSSVFAYWQPAEEPYIASLELWDYPEADDDIAGSLYGYRETDEMTVKLMRFSEDSETATQLASRIDFLVKDGMKAMFFALLEYDKVNDEPVGFADGMTLGVTIKLASEGFLGKNYKVYNMNSAEGMIAATVTESDPLSFTFITEGLGVFAVVYDPRLVSVGFYNDGTLYHTANLTLSDTISFPEAPTKDGYTFEGWYTEADGKGKKLEETMTYLDLGSENVYAYWIKNESPEPDIDVTVYTISSVSDFNNYAALIKEDNATYGSAAYILSDNLDVTGASLTPFGTVEAPFSGTLDGNGKVISNVTFDDVTYIGVVGYMVDGTVKNLSVKYNDTEPKTYTSCTRFGGIVGVIVTGEGADIRISGCKTSGKVKISTSGFMHYGGIFSNIRADEGDIKISNCVTYCNADISTGKTGRAGGFGGTASSYNTSAYDYVIENCLSYGNVSLVSSASESYGAGFVAYSFRDNPGFTDDIRSLSGGNESTLLADTDTYNFVNCISFGNSSVTATKKAHHGSFVGYVNEYVGFSNCYVSSSGETSGTDLCEVNASSKDPSGMNTVGFLTETLLLDFGDIWCLNGSSKADLSLFADKALSIDLGQKESEANKRYIEIDGIQTEIDTDIYTVPEGEENFLIEITEKNANNEVVKSEYYFVNRSENNAKKLSLDSYMNSSDEASVKTKNPTGLRFKARIETGAKLEEAEYVIDEYGFIVTRADLLGEGELTLDTDMKVTGVAYNRADGTDIVFDSDDEYCTFTGIIKNVPVEHYRTDLVCKTYTKITVDGEQFVVYGEAIVGNIYDTAKKLLETNPDNEGLINIVLDYEKTLGLSGDSLY